MANINAPIGWLGGKSKFLKWLLPFPKHNLFVDVFGGSGVVILNKIPSTQEVFNDINSQLINFYRCLQNRYEELSELCNYRGIFQSRELFYKYKEPTEDSLENAFRFFYTNRFGFSGNSRCFIGVPRTNRSFKVTYDNIVSDIFPIVNRRLHKIVIENQDFRTILERFDSKDTLFYIDPPYYKGGQEYEVFVGGVKWKESDFEDLWNIVKNLKSKCVISIDKKIDIEGWFYEKIIRTNSFRKTEAQASKSVEWIIRNYDPKSEPIMTKMVQRTLR